MILALRRVRPDIAIHLFASEDPRLDEVEFHPALGHRTSAKTWRFLRGAASAIARIKPDALWCPTHVPPLGLPKTLPLILTLLDVVWRDHPESMTFWNRCTSRIGEYTLPRADRIMCISEFTRSRLLHHWPALAERAHVIHLAPRSLVKETTRSASADSATPIVANVGTFEPRKNLGVLLDAMARLPDARLVQCGASGWKVDAIVRRAAAMANVTLRGYVSEVDLANLYAHATVAVYSSVYEGFDLPPLHAMSLGCPVVASDIPVHREILGDAPLYFQPSDAAGLATSLRAVFDDKTTRARLVTAGYARAARYSWDTAATRLAALLETTIGSQSRE